MAVRSLWVARCAAAVALTLSGFAILHALALSFLSCGFSTYFLAAYAFRFSRLAAWYSADHARNFSRFLAWYLLTAASWDSFLSASVFTYSNYRLQRLSASRT